MATTAVLTMLAPVAGAQDAEDESAMDNPWVCVPAQDRDAASLTINGATYYLRVYGTSAYKVEELWQETNTDRGLQITAGMSCVGKSDRLVKATCVGLCPLTL